MCVPNAVQSPLNGSGNAPHVENGTVMSKK